MRDKIVIAGAGILDVLVQPAKEDIFLKGSVPADTIKISTGGDALNEATVLARLKRPEQKTEAVYLLTVLGEDEAGGMIAARCREEGISMELAIRDADLETGINVVLVQEDGQRSFFTNPQSSLRKLAWKHFPERFPEDAGIFCMASIFVSPELGEKELKEIFQMAKAQNMIVCADMTRCKNQESAQDMREALACVDYLFANEEEAALLTGRGMPGAAADELFACGVKNVIIKCGDRGCYVKNASLERQFPAVPGTRCIDTTGAGDAFAAGFLCALSEGKRLAQCIRWANACGSIATEAVGACEGIGSREQLKKRLERYA